MVRGRLNLKSLRLKFYVLKLSSLVIVLATLGKRLYVSQPQILLG